MRFKAHRWRLRLMLFASSLFVSPVVHSQARAVLKGKVVDPAGAAIESVSVALVSKSTTLETKSDPSGEFEFANLAPGTYRLTVERPAFKTTTIESIQITRDQSPLQRLTVTMQLADMRSGDCGLGPSSVSYKERVPGAPQIIGAMVPMPPRPEPDVSWPYHPFSDAVIEVRRVGSGEVVASKHPDAHGKFEFSGLPPGEYTIRASYAGYNDHHSVKFGISAESEDIVEVTIEMLPQGETVVCM